MKGYGDMIPLPRPVSDQRLPMPMRNRAAQFAPFAALTGYDEAVQEAGRRTDRRPEVSEDQAEDINRCLCWLRDHIYELPEITVTWFVPDERKAGGALRTATDHAKHLDERRRILYLQCGVSLPTAEILKLSARSFEQHDIH